MSIKLPENPLPYLDPRFVPSHPYNHIPEFETIESDYWGSPRVVSPRERDKLRKEWYEQAMVEWQPPHILRYYEVNETLAKRRAAILNMVLHPRIIHEFESLNPKSKHDSSISKKVSDELYHPDRDPDKIDFRRYMNLEFHLGYHRFHASQGEPNVPSEEETPVEELDICWIMEYSENECHIARRRLAKEAMGLFPAVLEEDSGYYDFEEEGRWERRIYTRCRRKTKRCVRPSHIVLFGSNFEDLP